MVVFTVIGIAVSAGSVVVGAGASDACGVAPTGPNPEALGRSSAKIGNPTSDHRRPYARTIPGTSPVKR